MTATATTLVSDSKLDEFFDAMDGIEAKNNGGCLFFCYAFWMWLKKEGLPTDSFQILQHDWSDSNRIDDNLAWIDGSYHGEAQSSYHFTWEYQGKTYDGDGWSEESFERVEELTGLNTPHSCLVEAFCKEALNCSDWNWSFHRNTAIDQIEENLGLNLFEVRMEE